MGAYILRRLLLVIPTLFGIMVLNFALIQFVPGGPIEQIIAQLEGRGDVFEGIAGGGSEVLDSEGGGSDYIGGVGLPAEFIEELEREFGFDKPPLERFLNMMWNYIRFDFGESYFRNISVVDLVLEKMPVSITLGLWSTLIAYLVSIPLGIRKAVRDGSSFDTWTSGAIIVGYAIPGFLFAILLIVLFAGGSYWRVFPLRGLTSDDWEAMSWLGQFGLYLPYLIAAFATSMVAGTVAWSRALGRTPGERARAFGFGAVAALAVVGFAFALVARGVFGDGLGHLWIVLLPVALAILWAMRRLNARDRVSLPERLGPFVARISLAAIPGLLWGIFAIACLSVGGLISATPAGVEPGSGTVTLFGRVGDYFWHIALPVLASTIAAFATLTLLTKNSFLDEIKKQYVMTARAKGLTERRVLYGHVFRNGMLIVISGFPALFIGVFFGGSLIIETLFSLDGLGRLGFEAAVARDYPVVFGTLFTFSLIGLVVGILTDLTYVLIDPRIDFESRR